MSLFTKVSLNMRNAKKKITYPQNLYLIDLRKESGISVKKLAEKIGYSRQAVSETIHGHRLGTNIQSALLNIFNK